MSADRKLVSLEQRERERETLTRCLLDGERRGEGVGAPVGRSWDYARCSCNKRKQTWVHSLFNIKISFINRFVSKMTDLTNSRFYCDVTESSSRHGLVVDGGLWVCGGEVWAGVVPALVVVVFDVKAGELGEADSQGAAGVVDVLTVQRLREKPKTVSEGTIKHEAAVK